MEKSFCTNFDKNWLGYILGDLKKIVLILILIHMYIKRAFYSDIYIKYIHLNVQWRIMAETDGK
jgi:hypothetical protein